jgi:hypothetical protein
MTPVPFLYPTALHVPILTKKPNHAHLYLPQSCKWTDLAFSFSTKRCQTVSTFKSYQLIFPHETSVYVQKWKIVPTEPRIHCSSAQPCSLPIQVPVLLKPNTFRTRWGMCRSRLACKSHFHPKFSSVNSRCSTLAQHCLQVPLLRLAVPSIAQCGSRRCLNDAQQFRNHQVLY